jgi:hypothetical protein
MMMTKAIVLCGVSVTLYSLDGNHWDSNVDQLRTWHKDYDAAGRERALDWRTGSTRPPRRKKKKHDDERPAENDDRAPGEVDADLVGMTRIQAVTETMLQKQEAEEGDRN